MAFERFGKIDDVYIPKDFYTRRPRNFGYVQFCTEADAEDALDEFSKDGMFQGKRLVVSWAQGGRKDTSQMKEREYALPPPLLCPISIHNSSCSSSLSLPSLLPP